jgi:hypothetical protein
MRGVAVAADPHAAPGAALEIRVMAPPATLRLLPLLLLAALAGSGCVYKVEGRVIEGDADFVTVVRSNDPRLAGRGIGGARLSFTRDPFKLNRQEVAQGVSDGDGDFSIPIDAFGAGWLEEQWLVRALRSGFGYSESVVAMPRSGERLLIMLRPAHPSEHREMERQWRDGRGGLMEEVQRWNR